MVRQFSKHLVTHLILPLPSHQASQVTLLGTHMAGSAHGWPVIPAAPDLVTMHHSLCSISASWACTPGIKQHLGTVCRYYGPAVCPEDESDRRQAEDGKCHMRGVKCTVEWRVWSRLLKV